MQKRNSGRLIAISAALLMLAACGSSDNNADKNIQCGKGELFSATHTACDTMMVQATDGPNGEKCRCVLGYFWNGSSCEALNGCSCKGADCDKLTMDPQQCVQNHAACGEMPGDLACGSSKLSEVSHDSCEALDAQANGDCLCLLGYAWNGNECVMLGGCECKGADCNKLSQTQEACVAAHESCGATSSSFACGSRQLYENRHDSCEAMDAMADGPCFCMLGFAWDGKNCVMLGGCECKGIDCDKLYETAEDCQAASQDC